MSIAAVTSRAPTALSPARQFLAHHAELRRARAWRNGVGLALFAAAFAVSAWIGDLDPRKIAAGLPRLGEFIEKILPEIRAGHVGADLAEWFLPWRIWLRLLGETILIAFLGSVLGTAGALALSFPASRNLMPVRAVQFAARRTMEIARTVPELVYALIFVICFGVGPMAGVLAIAVHTTGALGKLYAEVNENADPHPLEGLRAAGASWSQTIRYALIPQVLPNFVSYTLLRFEINVRSSSIIGYVGAGGLGQEINTVIAMNTYVDLSALFLIIVLTVVAIDLTSERIRHAFIGREGLAP
jgi:phosphonate transport system permease protein